MKLALPTVVVCVLALALLAATSVDAFSAFPLASTSPRTLIARSAFSALASTRRDDDDFPPPEKGGDEYKGNVDWDAEWKKVVEKEKAGESVDRPGKDFYKSDAEIAAIRAANKAQKEVTKISQKLPSPPSMDMGSLTSDWRVSKLQYC